MSLRKPDITDNGVGVVTIHNPEKLNAWNPPMRVEITNELKRLTELPTGECRAIVITGAGDAFCAGADLDYSYENYTVANRADHVVEYWDYYNLLRRCPKPVVAAVNGVAAGSGFQFALCADYRITHANARLGQPELKSGQASVTGSWLLGRIIGISRMRAMVLTGRLVNGQEAYRIGLVDELRESSEVLQASIETAYEMSLLPVEAFAETKNALCDLEDESFREAFEVAARAHVAVHKTGASARAMREFIARSKRHIPNPAESLVPGRDG